MNNEATIKKLANQANKVVIDRHAVGKMGLHMSSTEWEKGKIDLRVMTSIPYELTCKEAQELGWALYMLGKYGNDIAADKDHDLDDEDFFKD